VISVTMPAKSLWQTSLEVFGLIEATLVLLAAIIAFLFIHFVVINPIKSLTQAAVKISLGQPAELGINQVSQKSANEVHQLAFGLERLRTSMQLAIQRMKASNNKPT
jgi:HAMP domain-containing protein